MNTFLFATTPMNVHPLPSFRSHHFPVFYRHLVFAFVIATITDIARADDAARVPLWAHDAIFYQVFPERFRNGDSTNDPTHESLEFPKQIPESWKVTPWTQQWYRRDDWEKEMGPDFYEHGVFHRRYGGDLQGVIDKLDYIQSLGVNAIYLNPVFYARSLHKYDGNSFHHVDPHFGPDPKGDFELMAKETADPASWHWTEADKLFLRLIREAHARDIRIVLDGVFNHTGRDFFAFEDIRKKGRDSAYTDWYVIHQYDDPATEADELKYQCWWDFETLPEFANNADGGDLHPKPKRYIMQATARWMDPNGDGDPSDGIDGWRLDVANEVPNQFWRDWNRRVRAINPQAYTVAEFWQDAEGYLADCGFSATMNYHGFAYPIKGFLIDERVGAADFGRMLVERMNRQPQRVRYAMQNLLDSHDTERVASMIVNSAREKNRSYIDGEKFDYDVGERSCPRAYPPYDISPPSESHRDVQKLTALLQMTFVGAPMLYYGTEVGMDGADDPDDRMPMLWGDLQYEARSRHPRSAKSGRKRPVKVNEELLEFYRDVIGLRREHTALRRGDFEVVATHDHQQMIAFTRSDGNERLLVVLNRGDNAGKLKIPLSSPALSGAENLDAIFITRGETNMARSAKTKKDWVLRLPPRTGAVWAVHE